MNEGLIVRLYYEPSPLQPRRIRTVEEPIEDHDRKLTPVMALLEENAIR